MDKPKAPADQERILCFDAETGRTIWQYAYDAKYADLDYGKGPRCTPTVFDGRVYTLGAVGHVHCLDAAFRHRYLEARFGSRLQGPATDLGVRRIARDSS